MLASSSWSTSLTSSTMWNSRWQETHISWHNDHCCASCSSGKRRIFFFLVLYKQVRGWRGLKEMLILLKGLGRLGVSRQNLNSHENGFKVCEISFNSLVKSIVCTENSWSTDVKKKVKKKLDVCAIKTGMPRILPPPLPRVIWTILNLGKNWFSITPPPRPK